MVKLLLEKGAEATAAMKNVSVTLSWCQDRAAGVFWITLPSLQGNTALMAAAYRGHKAVVEVIVEHESHKGSDANINAHNDDVSLHPPAIT